MKVLIVEDEHPAANYLKHLLLNQKIVAISEITLLDSKEQAVNHLKSHTPDLIFLDIQLSDGSSLEIFEHVTIDSPIIFTTAFDSYTLEAFKHFTIDYLIKPFEAKALYHALEKLNSIKRRISHEQILAISSQLHPPNNHQEKFLINFGQEMRSVHTNDIAYFYGSGKHLFIYTFRRESFIYDDTIRDIITKLDPHQFFKINRNYVVNIHSIKRVMKTIGSKLQVELVPSPPDKDKITIPKSETKAFKEWMNH